MISPQTIQQITSRIDIIDVIGEFIKLKKRGANYLGLCPFHGEKTPSFTVSPAKEIYKCFGCGRSGNTITFLMEHEKFSYVEALRWLAARYNVEIEETQVSDEVKQQQQAAESLYILNSFAQKFFATQLFDTEEGQNIALSYLEERGFTNETLQKFQVGYNPQARDAFAKAAMQNQFSAEVLQRSGLVVNRNDELIDNYRGRIIFPVHNNSGKIIGFGARVIGKADKAPKYINTPENELYIKSKILYGLYFARLAIDKNDECLLVEGYTDVISLSQAGVENVVASGGTSLTTDQLRLIKKYTNNLTIVYDGDSAGVKAALRGLDMALEESLNVHLVLIPDNEDPDSYVRLVGAQGFKDFVAQNKKDFILFQLDIMLKDAGNDVNKKNEVVNHIAETISKINKAEDFSKQEEYIRQSATLLRIDEGGLTNLVNKFIREKISKDEKKSPASEAKYIASQQTEQAADDAANLFLEDEFQEREIVKRLIEYGNQLLNEDKYVADAIYEVLQEFHLKNDKLDKIVDAYFNMLHTNGHIDTKTFLYSSDTEMNAFVAGLLHFPYEVHDWGRRMEGYSVKLDNDITNVINSALNIYKLRKIKRMYLELEDELSHEKNEEKYTGLIVIYKQLKEIERTLTSEMHTVYLK
ncbi:DNA primase [Panacibacter ginsenosidivorans]|uniref:DNA primase n=1 Tax=Panacibacter ginsenosidivorans TaxID=1813871 RepID=A0A5B8VDA8_9BACT|nr:DNA primase [Panacibacter ginsenosidivorans]QEC69035.1 DNA primase [Panacibacter ginsenosidivorans]